MKFKECFNDYERDVQEYANYRLNGEDYDRGQIEAIDATVDNIRESFSRMLEVLAERELLDKQEIEYILTGLKEERKNGK